MKALRVAAAAIAITAAFAAVMAQAQAGTRIYLMRGLGGALLSTAMDDTAAKLRRPGVTVMVGDFNDAGRFEQDVLAHPGDRIVLGGHSMGAWAAAEAACALAVQGRQAKVVGIDPLLTGAAVRCHAEAVNFYGQGLPMPGARNVFVASRYGHIRYASDPNVQARVIRAALGAAPAHRHRQGRARA